MRATVYIELIPDRSPYNGTLRGVTIGRTWKREPKNVTLPTGAIVARINLDVPADRLQHTVTAVIPAAAPIGGA